jgi:CheY-like chemotaxis protein
MNSGPNQPSSNNGGGRGRRRRRGRRGHGAPQTQGQPQASNTQGAQPQGAQPQGGHSQGAPRRHAGQQNRGQQNRRPGGAGGGKFQRRQRQDRGPANPRTPDAGIYSAPMDHSYRQNMQDDNGNGRRQAGRYQEQSAEAITSTNGNKPIYCFVDDLFFLAKIQETARKLNVKVEFVKAEKEVVDGILALEEKPSLIIFDLNSNTSKPLTLIPKLKAKLKKDTNFIGFLSHLQGDLKLKATEAGCDMVIPRSAFSQNLPQILRRHAADDLQDEHEAAGM